MNKEEILNTFLLANIPEIITQEEFNDVKKAIKQLLQENQKYKQAIDKAIEYIEIHKRKDEFLELNEWGTRDLLEILKGE